MIKGLYETHLQVSHIESSISFYKSLGLSLSLYVPERKMAFFYIGDDKQMLGLWEVPAGTIQQRHFAFRTELSDLLDAKEWLKKRGIETIKVFGKEPVEPIVHTWMPAASVYFYDLDGNELEFISWLNDTPKDIGYVPYLSEWNDMKREWRKK